MRDLQEVDGLKLVVTTVALIPSCCVRSYCLPGLAATEMPFVKPYCSFPNVANVRVITDVLCTQPISRADSCYLNTVCL